MPTRSECLQLLPPYEGSKDLITKNQNVDDIMNEVLEAHRYFARDYDSISDLFIPGPGSVPEKLFDFCKENLPYVIEPDKKQTTRSPAAMLAMGNGDCKHYAGFIAGVLDSLNRKGKGKYKWAYRFASYNFLDKDPGHVFVVVKTDQDTWIDPVLEYINQRNPYPSYYYDKKPKSMALARIHGMEFKSTTTGNYSASSNCQCDHSDATMGDTATDVGNKLQQLSPTLQQIPVVGYVASLVTNVVGSFLKIFGNGYHTSTGVRWLTQYYENYVLGQNQRSDNTVNENDVPAAQAWFSYVLGVPIYDKYRFGALKGYDTDANSPLNNTDAERVQAYLSFPDAAGQDPATVMQAVQIAKMMNWTDPHGSWAKFPPAPSTIQQQAATAAYDASGNAAAGTSKLKTFVKAHPLETGLIVVGAFIVIYELVKD